MDNTIFVTENLELIFTRKSSLQEVKSAIYFKCMIEEILNNFMNHVEFLPNLQQTSTNSSFQLSSSSVKPSTLLIA